MSVVSDDDRTMLLPRQHATLPPVDTDYAEHIKEPQLVTDNRPVAVGTAPVEDVFGRERALGTLAWILPTLVMGIIGLIRLSWPSLWADELATWGFATTPWDRAIPVLGDFDAVIGPYYLLMHGWAQLVGTSEFALRVPSVVAMAGAAGLVSAIGTRLSNARTGLLAGLIFAVIPTTSRYGQEARPYALALFAATLATFLLIRVLDRPGFLRYLCYALSLWLLGLAHVVALLLIPAHGLVLLAMRRRSFPAWLLAAIVGALPAVPLLYIGDQQKNQISWIPDADLTRVSQLPEALFGFTVLGGAVLALGLMSIGLTRQSIVFSLWALVPTIGLFLAAQLTPLWLPRYLLFTIPAWALLAALSLSRQTVFRALAAVAVLALIALPTHISVRRSDGHTQATRTLATTLAVNVQPGDGIVYGPNSRGEGRVGRDLVELYVPSDRRPADLLVRRPPRTDGHVLASECPNVAECLGETPRVWLIRVGSSNPMANLGTAKENALRESYAIERTWQFRGLTLCLLVRKDDEERPAPR
jgi:mannosyltransferase